MRESFLVKIREHLVLGTFYKLKFPVGKDLVDKRLDSGLPEVKMKKIHW